MSHTGRRFRHLALAFAICTSLALGSLLTGCGNSGDSTTSGSEKQPASNEPQADARIKRELKELERQHPSGQCRGELSAYKRLPFTSPQASCTLADNTESVYYAEIEAGPGTITPYEPRIEDDVTLRCSAGPIHRCVGNRDILIFFFD